MAADSRIKWPGWETARQIGQGNYGSVYEIQQITPHGIEKAAMKFVSIPRKDGDIAKLLSAGYDRAALTRRYENYLKGIVEEYAHLSEVKGHPNIVRCDEVRYNRHPDGIGWDVLIKMPLLTPLMSAMNGLSPRELSDTVLHVGRDISGALVFCGTQKLLHRDIKPQNVFVNAAGNFMLGDFGVAGLYEEIWNGAGTSTGVSAFLAPEICNRQAYGPKADVYSLGLTLYYLLNERRLPFLPLPPAMVTPELANQALSRRLKGEPLPPPKNGDPKLKTLIQLACAFDPQKRCSAEQLWEGMKVLTAIAANSASAAPKAAAPASPPPAAPTAPGSAPRTAPPAAVPAAAPKPAAPAPTVPSAPQATAPAPVPPASAPVILASATSTSTPAAPEPAAPASTAAAPKPAAPAPTTAAPKPAAPAPTTAAPKPAAPAPAQNPAAPKPAAPASSPAAPRSAASASGVPSTATPTAATAAPEAPRRVQQNSLRRDLPPQGPVGSAPPVSAPPPATPPVRPTPPESTPPRNGGKKKRSKAPWIAAACIAVILIAAGALWVTGVIPNLVDRFFPSDTPPAELVVTDAPDPTRQPTAEPGPGSTAGPGNTAQPVVTADPGSAAEPGQTADPAVTADPGSDPEPDGGPALPELVWSQWDDHLPGRVSGENSAIEMRLVYRSVPLLEVVDGDAPEGPYIKAEERTEYSEYDYANAYVTTTMPEADDLTQWTEEPVTASMWSAWKCWVPDYQTPKGKYQSRDNFTGKDAITYNGVAWGTIYRDYLGEKTVQINYTVVKRHRYDYYYDDEAWSEYSPEPITQAKDVLVMSKMQYRYAASENGTVAEPSMENFPVFDENYIGRFRDIPEDAWYAPEKSSILRTVCELGILLPDRRMNFRPEDPVTLGQVIRAAVMIHRIYNGSAPLLTENDGNYQPYLDYAVAHGLMRAGELTDLGREATRQEMAYLFCRALPEEELQAVREDINEIKDMDKAYVYYEYALRLARANIITLQQDDTFKPEDGATRAQLASIVDKLIYPRHR